ncbi:MAG: hypothetical protein ACREAU_00165 [Nitrosopumilaceae archaeon]
MSRKLTKELFIIKSNKLHNEKYLYSQVEYVNTKTKVNIICPIHGEFKQTPAAHLRGCGCKLCGYASHSYNQSQNKIAASCFIEKVTQKHHGKYVYTHIRYINTKTKVNIICPIHGEFKQTPFAHLRGSNCKKCAVEITTEDFIKKATSLHKNRYQYTYVVYKHHLVPVVIICLVHGPFKQKPRDHMQGCGCPECGKYITCGGRYSEQLFIETPDNRFVPAYLYLIRFIHEKSTYLKVGISKFSDIFGRRYSKRHIEKYNMVLLYHKKLTLYEAFLEEQQILKKFHWARAYLPPLPFGGHTECFENLEPIIKNFN